MKLGRQAIAAKLLIVFTLVLGCQTITDKFHMERDKDTAISKAVKEALLKDKSVDLTDVNVRTADGSVALSGTVSSLNAREHAVKLAWQVTDVRAVVNHLEVTNK